MNRLASLLALPLLAVACTTSTGDETSGSDTKPIVADDAKPVTDGAEKPGTPGYPPKPGAPDPQGEACGAVTCGEGTVCCNASCGICTKPGMACHQALCESPPEKPPVCFKTGCSGQVCSDTDIATTCEWKPEYACFQDAICERQTDGQCGFRPTVELKDCLSGAK